jgi:hypothetical protein
LLGKGTDIVRRINYWAVLVAAIVYYILGGLWYSLLFQNKFVVLMHYTPEQLAAMQAKGDVAGLVIVGLTSLLLAAALAIVMRWSRVETIGGGLAVAILLWIGFVGTSTLETVLFENREPGLYLINNGYHLVGMCLMAIILSLWRGKPEKVEG